MNVLLTFDVEIWCNSWTTLEEDFPTSFERYIFGRSPAGDFALPKTLEMLDHHGLKGVFFVEPLFAARFGIEHLATVVKLIKQAGQEIQLHLHPEWTDEAVSPLLADIPGKRQNLSDYSRVEQSQLIAHGIRLLREAGADMPNAFRSGSFACNSDTFNAVALNGMKFDSSINSTLPVSQPGAIRNDDAGYCEPFTRDGLAIYPMSVFRDGFGRLRHAQIGACSARELCESMQQAHGNGWGSFVLLSHNFEMMKPDRCEPDYTVVRRFERVCRFLSDNAESMPTSGFHSLGYPGPPLRQKLPQTRMISTSIRYVEQTLRRLNHALIR